MIATIGSRTFQMPTAALESIADSKVMQWANEARRLNARELREYMTPRPSDAATRHAPPCAGQVLD